MNTFDTLDNPLGNYPQESSVSMMPTVLRYGLIGGLVLMVVNLFFAVSGINVFSMGMAALTTFLTFAIYLVMMVMAVKKHRDQDLGGYISFLRAFLVAFLASMLAALIANFVNWIYGNFIDPGYADRIREGAIEMYENMGMSEEQMDMAMEQLQNPYSVSKIMMGLVFGAIIGAVISLVIGAVMKREKPKIA